MSEFWDGYGEYDAAVEELKGSLRASVKDEIKKRIDDLIAENRTLKEKLQGLDALEFEAKQAKAQYERDYSTAKREAIQEVRKEELGKLLQAIDERLFTVERAYADRQKCDLCNDDRRIEYTTPSGRVAFESCDCAAKDPFWEVHEVVAHEVSRRDRALTVWWVSTQKWGDEDQLSPRVLKPSFGVDMDAIKAHPMEYSFRDRVHAQAVVDALKVTETEPAS